MGGSRLGRRVELEPLDDPKIARSGQISSDDVDFRSSSDHFRFSDTSDSQISSHDVIFRFSDFQIPRFSDSQILRNVSSSIFQFVKSQEAL